MRLSDRSKETNSPEESGPLSLILNAGSSSIKFGIFTYETCNLLMQGQLVFNDKNILTLTYAAGDSYSVQSSSAGGLKGRAGFLIQTLEVLPLFSRVRAVGHRVVRSLYQSAPALANQALVEELKAAVPTDPEHLPLTITLIETLLWRHPALFQFACFDTDFHQNLPKVASILPIPRRFGDKGIKRYGFHGISYAYLMAELDRLGSPFARQGKVILAHLGNGASMTAVLDGKPIDTSMGFTPSGGLPMSNRAGDLDSGLVAYLASSEKLGGEELQKLLNQESGLLGISGLSASMEELLAIEKKEPPAAEAIAYFCYQAKKFIGAYSAALGGLDALVFSGGIGAQSPEIRTRICTGLGYLGIELNPVRNSRRGPEISAAHSRVKVYAMATNEELMIARTLADTYELNSKPMN